MAGEYLMDRPPVPCHAAPDLWFEDGLDRRSQNAQKLAKARCNEPCPIKDKCLADAMAAEAGKPAAERRGIFGGLDPYDRAERAGFKVNRPVSKRTPPQCGTEAGYNAHRADGEPACRPCLDSLRRPTTTPRTLQGSTL